MITTVTVTPIAKWGYNEQIQLIETSESFYLDNLSYKKNIHTTLFLAGAYMWLSVEHNYICGAHIVSDLVFVNIDNLPSKFDSIYNYHFKVIYETSH